MRYLVRLVLAFLSLPLLPLLATPRVSLPVRFEENGGQADGEILYLVRGTGRAVAVIPAGLMFRLGGQTVRMRLAPGSGGRAEGAKPIAALTNYYLGSDRRRWRTGIRNYSRVRLVGVRKGVDVVFYGDGPKIEYDLEFQPGADVAALTLQFDGADEIRVDGERSLVVRAGGEELSHRIRESYQVASEGKRAVNTRYVMASRNEVRLQVSNYDPSLTLVVDPILTYASYLGGSVADSIAGVAVDAQGYVYLAGYTSSPEFPTVSAFQGTRSGQDAFVAKLHPSGMSLVFCTFLGGSGEDGAGSLALDAAGDLYVTGYTRGGFPTTSGAFKTAGSGAFVAKMSSDGTRLLYSTILGGSRAGRIAVDAGGNAYITGTAESAEFPTTAGAFQATFKGASGQSDAFVAKLKADGSGLVYSTFLGGTGRDEGRGIAVDAGGYAYVTGYTWSRDFPTARAAQAAHGGSACLSSSTACYDAFVTRLDPAGATLSYSTYLGGAKNDYGFGITVDSAQNAYVTGYTESSPFPTTAGAYQRTLGGSTDAFVVKYSAAGAVVYSTLLGAKDPEGAYAVVVSSDGTAYVTGQCGDDFPTVSPVHGGSPGRLFVAAVKPAGDGLSMSTRLGVFGEYRDGYLWDLTRDGAGNIYLVGEINPADTRLLVPALQAQSGTNTHGSNDTGIFVKLAQGGALNAASFARTAVAPEAFTSIFAANLATGTASTSSADLPTVLGGTSLNVTDSTGVTRPAPLSFVSPGQVNFLVPRGTSAGVARFEVRAADGRTFTDWMPVQPVAPGLFTANANGVGAPAALLYRVDTSGNNSTIYAFRYDETSRSYVPNPLDLDPAGGQAALLLFGTGIRGASGVAGVRATVGGDECNVFYAGAQGEFPGLDQVNCFLPYSVAGLGTVDVELTVDGVAANTVQINLAGVPVPRISYLRPFGAEVGRAVDSIAINGRSLGTVTAVQISPPDGVALSNLHPGDNRATVRVVIDGSAATGARTLTVTGPGGVSNAMPFFILPAGASPAPTITNVRVGGPSVELGYINLSGHFDYQDPDGDIVWATTRANYYVDSARIRFVVNMGTGTCVMEATGAFLNRPGQTSGSVDYFARFRLATVTAGVGITGTLQLQDAAGNRSNAVSFSAPWWACGNN